MLATLLLRAGEVVSVAALTNAIWDDDPPASVRNTIQGHVKRLRRAMGCQAARIVTRFPGYLIEVGPGELDLAVFLGLREQARNAEATGSWQQAADLLREALAWWHGVPLSDVVSPYLERTEVPRLTELRDEATTARIDADLNLGRHGAVTAELRALVAEHRFRERFWEQLVLALYRDGRQADALDAYADARRTLRIELGIDPGPRLRALHAQILKADPVLDLRLTPQSRLPARRQDRRVLRRLSTDLPRSTRHAGESAGLRECLADQPGSVPGATIAPRGESVKMVRFLARAFEAAGFNARQLVRDARIPDWVLRREESMVSPYFAMRMWEVGEHAFGDPHLPFAVAARFRPGELDLYDYLFTTAPTLRDGFALSSRYLHLMTTNATLEVEAETDHEVTYSYRYLDADGRGAELGLQFCAAVLCARASAGTEQPVTPTRAAFTHRAPRSHRGLTETLGTTRVDFNAPVTTFTFRSRDLDVPMPGADPVLAKVLTRYADTLSPAPSTTGERESQLRFTQELEDGRPALAAVARGMTFSPYSLQRSMADRSMNWRAALSAGRRWRASQLRGHDPAGTACQGRSKAACEQETCGTLFASATEGAVAAPPPPGVIRLEVAEQQPVLDEFDGDPSPAGAG